jgi:hypothetical protein
MPIEPFLSSPLPRCSRRQAQRRPIAGRYLMETDGVHPMVAHMRQQERSGGMQCVNVGSGLYRGSTVTKIRAENPSVQKKNRLVHIFWIDQGSGLPLYQEAVGHKGGSAIVYGDAVKVPVVGK